jgi:hypothetical protein
MRFQCRYEGRMVYGEVIQGDSDETASVAHILPKLVTTAASMADPRYYDAWDDDGTCQMVLVVDGGLPTGTILQKVVYMLVDTEDPEAVEPDDVDDIDWDSIWRPYIVQPDGTLKVRW